MVNIQTNKKTINQKQYYGTGRRKSSVARAFLRTSGTGNIIVNRRPLEEYFGRSTCCVIVRQPLHLLNLLEEFDFYITVIGGGISGQAGAIRHAITRALVAYAAKEIDETDSEGVIQRPYHRKLRDAGFVTRDARRVERKKIGCRKARKVEQYSKR